MAFIAQKTAFAPLAASLRDLVEDIRALADDYRADRAAAQERAASRAELFALSDRDLADIGIARHDIPRIVDTTARR